MRSFRSTNFWGSQLTSYLLAIATIALATVIRWTWPGPLAGTPYLIFYPAVVISAAFGGAGPGLLATIGSGLAVDLLFDLTPGRFDYNDSVTLGRIIIFLIGGAGVSFIAGQFRAGRAQERRLAAETAHQKQLLSVMLTSIGDAIIATDAEGRVTFLNPEAERLTGWSSAEAAGKPLPAVFNIINEHTRQVVENPVQKVLRSGTVVGLANHTTLIAKDGRETPIDDSGAPIRQSDGGVQGVVLVFRDFTEKKQAEEELRQSAARLNRSQEMAQLGSWELDLVGNRLVWTDEVYRLFGLQPQEFGATYEAFLERTHPDDRAAVDAAYTGSLREGRDSYEIEHRIVRKNSGEVRIVHEKCQHVRDPSGRIVRSLGMVQDITDRKRAEEALRETKENAEQANAAKDRFLAALSHELRTPLTPVLAASQMLERREDLPASAKAYIEIIKRNVKLEARLIDDLLDLNRIVHGKLHLDLSDVDLHDLIRQAAETCRNKLEEKGQQLSLELEANLAIVNADASRLQQVLWNLLSNAIKFTQPGGRITVKTGNRDEKLVEVKVVDNGKGIDSETLPLLFTAFEQGKDSVARNFGGLGLGLAISRNLVEMHGGTIQAYSQGLGRGSVFTLTLATTPTPINTAKTDPKRKSSQLKNEPRKILLVEDHADTAETMRRALDLNGHKVHHVSSVASAIEAARNEKFDLLLCDIGLPDGSGLEVASALRSRNVIAKAVAMTGFGREEDIKNCEASGFDAHLTKPVDIEALERLIESL